MSDPVDVRMDREVAIVTLSGDCEHALTPELVQRVSDAVGCASANRSVRAIVLRAEGGDFCQGLDLNVFRGDGRLLRSDLRRFTDCLLAICRSPAPVVACVEGRASGGGLGLVAACDLVLAAPTATFVLPEVVLGLLPLLVTPFVRRRLTVARVRYLSLSSRTIGAAEAHTFGLVDELIDDMATGLNRQLRRLLCASPVALAAAKEGFERCGAVDLETEVDLALDEAVRWLEVETTRDALRTFADGGVPPWFPKDRSARFV